MEWERGLRERKKDRKREKDGRKWRRGGGGTIK